MTGIKLNPKKELRLVLSEISLHDCYRYGHFISDNSHFVETFLCYLLSAIT